MITDRLQADLDRYHLYKNDTFVRYTHRLRINLIQQLIISISEGDKRTEPLKALDAGCCHGVYSMILAEAGYEVRGMDIDEEEIKKARHWAIQRRLQDRIDFYVGDIENIDERDSTFDLVVCSEVLEHIDEPGRGARELYRVLKPNGRAIISMPNMFCFFGLLQWAYRASGVRSLFGKPPLDNFQIQHSRYWFGNIQRILKENGFWIDRTYSTSHIPYIWKIDAFLENLGMGGSLTRAEGLIGRLPILRYLGYNFIVVARKPGPETL
jgi:2-polyprenyl-3-methyl-5-hydroxy-6-metoxy-1,4-benzoquinol methylase